MLQLKEIIKSDDHFTYPILNLRFGNMPHFIPTLILTNNLTDRLIPLLPLKLSHRLPPLHIYVITLSPFHQLFTIISLLPLFSHLFPLINAQSTLFFLIVEYILLLISVMHAESSLLSDLHLQGLLGITLYLF